VSFLVKKVGFGSSIRNEKGATSAIRNEKVGCFQQLLRYCGYNNDFSKGSQSTDYFSISLRPPRPLQ